jgi:hypothetical protein
MKITTQKQAETVPAKATPYGLGNNLYLAVIEETYGHDPALNDAERAYRRGKAQKKRRMVLKAWNAYASASKVVPFPAPAKVA